MQLNYNRLWKLLIDHGINRTKLGKEAGVSSNVIAKLGRNETVQVKSLAKICKVLNCTIDDIMELVSDNESEKGG